VFPGPVSGVRTMRTPRNRKLADMLYAGGDLVALPAEDATRIELPCRLADPELFFAESPTDVEEAKALCLDCPVRERCLAGALERREPWGVWGGELFLQGVVIPRKRPRGRPRKSEQVAAQAGQNQKDGAAA